MARTINDVYNLCRYIVKKERGVFYKIPSFNQNLDAGMFDAIEWWWEQYGVDQKIHDAIRPLRVYQPFTSDSSGFVTFPSNYIHLIGQPFTIYGSAVTKPTAVNEDELPFALTSVQRAVSMEYPIMIDTATGISFYPQQTQIGTYFYLRRHASPVLAYTQVGRVVTYDAANSVQIELNEIYWNNIIARSLRYVGINMDEKAISDFAEMYNAETK
jgi:hypothetical protein